MLRPLFEPHLPVESDALLDFIVIDFRLVFGYALFIIESEPAASECSVLAHHICYGLLPLADASYKDEG
jgi:hypothetical protein